MVGKGLTTAAVGGGGAGLVGATAGPLPCLAWPGGASTSGGGVSSPPRRPESEADWMGRGRGPLAPELPDKLTKKPFF